MNNVKTNLSNVKNKLKGKSSPDKKSPKKEVSKSESFDVLPEASQHKTLAENELKEKFDLPSEEDDDEDFMSCLSQSIMERVRPSIEDDIV